MEHFHSTDHKTCLIKHSPCSKLNLQYRYTLQNIWWGNVQACPYSTQHLQCNHTLLKVNWTSFTLYTLFKIYGYHNFFIIQTQTPTVEPTQPPIQWTQGIPSPRVQQLGHDADHSPAWSTHVKCEWIYTSTPPLYAFKDNSLFHYMWSLEIFYSVRPTNIHQQILPAQAL